VDTGAFDCLAPRDALESIGLMPRGEREYVPADGSAVGLEFAIAEVELMGEPTGTVIIFGDADAQPFLSATVLDPAGFEVDPREDAEETAGDTAEVLSAPSLGRVDISLLRALPTSSAIPVFHADRLAGFPLSRE